MRRLGHILEGLFDMDADTEFPPEIMVLGLAKKWAEDKELQVKQNGNVLRFEGPRSYSIHLSIEDNSFNEMAEIMPDVKFEFRKVRELSVEVDLKGVNIELLPEDPASKRVWNDKDRVVVIQDKVTLTNCTIKCNAFWVYCFYRNITTTFTNSYIECNMFMYYKPEKQKLSDIKFRNTKVKTHVVNGDILFLQRLWPESFKNKDWIKVGPTYMKDFDIYDIYPKSVFECDNYFFEKDSRKVAILIHWDGREFIQSYAILTLYDKSDHLKYLMSGNEPVISEDGEWLKRDTKWIKVKGN